MAEYFDRIGDIFTDLSSKVVIGSLAIALGLALVGSIFYHLLRGRKGSDPVAPLCGLMFAVSLVSMAIGVGYVRTSLPDSQARPTAEDRHATSTSTGRAILRAADIDKDGHLTPSEVVELVRMADTGRKGYADLFDLDHLRASRPPAPGVAKGPGDCPRMPPGPGCGDLSPSTAACFPPSGGATGHEIWPVITRHDGPPRHPKF